MSFVDNVRRCYSRTPFVRRLQKTPLSTACLLTMSRDTVRLSNIWSIGSLGVSSLRCVLWRHCTAAVKLLCSWLTRRGQISVFFICRNVHHSIITNSDVWMAYNEELWLHNVPTLVCAVPLNLEGNCEKVEGHSIILLLPAGRSDVRWTV